MRASDDDREKVAAELKIHCVEGRITLDELDKRIEGVMAARTIRDLAEFVVPASLDRTRDVALNTIAPALNGYGYELVSPRPSPM